MYHRLDLSEAIDTYTNTFAMRSCYEQKGLGTVLARSRSMSLESEIASLAWLSVETFRSPSVGQCHENVVAKPIAQRLADSPDIHCATENLTAEQCYLSI